MRGNTAGHVSVDCAHGAVSIMHIRSAAMPATSWSVRRAIGDVGASATDSADTIARRRVLIVCPEPPAPPTWGFALRVYHLARELGRRNDVSLLTYDTGDPGRDWEHLGELFTVHRVAARPVSRRRAQLRSLWSRDSFHIGRLRSAAMQRAIQQLTAHARFDVIQVESSQMFGFDFPAGPALVLDEHNIEYDVLARTARVERSPARRLYQRLEQRKVWREEIASWSRASGCVVTSADDQRRLLTEAPSTPTCLVPNGVDLDRFAPVPAPVDPTGLVFVGSINYRPNTDAVLHCAQRILPLIRRSAGDATLTVVGQGAPPAVRRLDGGAVRVAGMVPDVRPYLASAAVVVVPLRIGGGTRLKVLEALAMGKAVVSTSLGCEGIDVEDGRHLLIADDPAHFAACVLRLLRDQEFARRLGTAGRELVQARYGWATVGERLDAFHAQLVGQMSGVRRGR